MSRVILILFCVALAIGAPQSGLAQVTFTLVNSIDVSGVAGASPHDVAMVNCQLYVVGIGQTSFGRYDPLSGSLLGTFQVTDTLGNPIGIHDYGFDYNSATNRLIHVYDDDAGGPFTFDAYFESTLGGTIVKGPFDLRGAGDNSEDPNGVTADPNSGRVWVSTVNEGLFEINPNTGAQIGPQLVAPFVHAVAFNPATGTLFYSDNTALTIREVQLDGTPGPTVFTPNQGSIVLGLSFTPTGDLALCIRDTGMAHVYDSSSDADATFLGPECTVSIEGRTWGHIKATYK